MITCHDIYDMASAYHDGDLSDAEREGYEHHLELCVQCEIFYRGFHTTIERARDVLLVEPPPDLAEAMVERVRKLRTA